jgi:hypothetical protein
MWDRDGPAMMVVDWGIVVVASSIFYRRFACAAFHGTAPENDHLSNGTTTSNGDSSKQNQASKLQARRSR